MHFAAVAVVFATAVSAHQDVLYSTFYSTEHITVTACHPTVTNCPGRATSTVHTLTTTAASFPAYQNTSVPYPPVPTPPPVVIQNPVPESSTCPVSVRAITTQVTSVFPTVIYETVPGSCPPPLPTAPVVQPVQPPYQPPYQPPTNTTTPKPTYTLPPRPTGTSPVTAGASAMRASTVLLAVGLVAAIFA